MIYNAGLIAHNIMRGFEKTGLWPLDPSPAIQRVLNKQRKARQAINPAYASLLPAESRFQMAADAINHMREKYNALLSSPTREGLR